MTFDCSKILNKCKAHCCRNAPIEKEIWERNQDKLVRPVETVHEFVGIDQEEGAIPKDLVLPLTKDQFCPFLNQDLSCNIHSDKPSVCKKYGSETHPCLVCPFQDKNGRMRSRQESRGLLRLERKCNEKLMKE